MSSLVRQKSVKNIILKMQKHRKQLKIDQLKTEPTQNHINHLQLQKLYHKYDQSELQKVANLEAINSMIRKCYDANLIYLDDSIEFNEKKEHLKRFYYEWEHNQKIILLGEYYQFHIDQPRIFLQDIHQIVTDYQEDKRQLEYQNVKDRIQHQKVNQQNNLQADERYNGNSHKNLLKHENKAKKSNFILKDLLNNYELENKKEKAQNQKEKHAQNPPKSINLNKDQILQKTTSLNSKKMFSNKSEHHKVTQNHKNFNKLFSIKNAQNKELKNLQSKYTEIISDMFKKRRQSSKTAIQMKKIENKLNEKSHKISEQKNRIISSRQQKNSLEKSNKNQAIKVVRSKSQSHMNFIKPQTFLKPYEPKISSKFIGVKSIKFTSISVSRKGKNMTQNQSSKRQKNSSNQSKNDRNSSIKQREDKTVRVFEITKKDLIQYSTEKEHLRAEKSKGKQNEENENRKSQQQPEEEVQKSSKKQDQPKKLSKLPHKKQVRHEQKGGGMFSRVIKNKIRS